jgi:hypothetical protein
LSDFEPEHVVGEDAIGCGKCIATAEVPLAQRRLVPDADVPPNGVVLRHRVTKVVRPVPAFPVHELAPELPLWPGKGGLDDLGAHAASLLGFRVLLYGCAMGINLWWARNDGMSGHAWLSADDMRALVEEMRAQGVEWDTRRQEVSADDVDQALGELASAPWTYVEPKLWADWLAFLAGARENGGIVIR